MRVENLYPAPALVDFLGEQASQDSSGCLDLTSVEIVSPDLRQGMSQLSSKSLASLGVEPEKERGAKAVLSWD